MVNTTTLCVGLVSSAVIGYCIYFDHKRRSHPDFKKKLREKRRKTKQGGAGSGGITFVMPDFRDQQAVQNFFLEQVQLGEDLLAQGQIETGVEHLAMAVAVCGQPHALLGVLQQTIPPQIYALLLQSLEKAQRRVRASAASSIPGLASRTAPSAGGPEPIRPGSIEDLE